MTIGTGRETGKYASWELLIRKRKPWVIKYIWWTTWPARLHNQAHDMFSKWTVFLVLIRNLKSVWGEEVWENPILWKCLGKIWLRYRGVKDKIEKRNSIYFQITPSCKLLLTANKKKMVVSLFNSISSFDGAHVFPDRPQKDIAPVIKKNKQISNLKISRLWLNI